MILSYEQSASWYLPRHSLGWACGFLSLQERAGVPSLSACCMHLLPYPNLPMPRGKSLVYRTGMVSQSNNCMALSLDSFAGKKHI
jgi:hypothetical protein